MWSEEDTRVQTWTPISNQMRPFLCKIVTAVPQHQLEYTLLQMKDWHAQRRNAESLFPLSYFVFLCVSPLILQLPLNSSFFPSNPSFCFLSDRQLMCSCHISYLPSPVNKFVASHAVALFWAVPAALCSHLLCLPGGLAPSGGPVPLRPTEDLRGVSLSAALPHGRMPSSQTACFQSLTSWSGRLCLRATLSLQHTSGWCDLSKAY